MKECAVLYSGGTDSTCAAALCASEFDRVHLLIFDERATRGSPIPIENIRRLRERFGEDRIQAARFSTDRLVRKLSYHRYAASLARHGLFLLSTPGFSSLSWHLRTIAYCRENEIHFARDGMTRELTHLPGHMPGVRKLIQALYSEFRIDFDSPVIDWAVPPEQRFTDRLIVDRHGFAADASVRPGERTTGRYLYEQGILPHENVKGSLFDQRMQHDCYPFVVFNLFAFWWFLPWHSRLEYEKRMESLMGERIAWGRDWLASHAELAELFGPGVTLAS